MNEARTRKERERQRTLDKARTDESPTEIRDRNSICSTSEEKSDEKQHVDPNTSDAGNSSPSFVGFDEEAAPMICIIGSSVKKRRLIRKYK